MMKHFIIIIFLISAWDAFPQEAVKPRPSPTEVVTCRYKDAYLKIVYSRPQKRGREVFGKLVPYGQVWRTGANEATEMTISRDIKINGTELKAGNYSIFTIPEKSVWTIIINSDLGLWGAYNYNPTMDVLRFEVPVIVPTAIGMSDTVYEAFTIWIDQKNEKAEIQMAWDKSKVTLSVQFLEPKQ